VGGRVGAEGGYGAAARASDEASRLDPVAGAAPGTDEDDEQTTGRLRWQRWVERDFEAQTG
jgi:hypothetical protein